MSETFALKVNGKTHQVEVEPDTALLYVLRNDLGLYGAKYGCGVEQCGACNVIIDDEAVNSCSITVAEAEGREDSTADSRVAAWAHLGKHLQLFDDKTTFDGKLTIEVVRFGSDDPADEQRLLEGN